MSNPVTTVFEIGDGTFTVVLYPDPTTSSSSRRPTTTSGSLTISRNSTRTVDANQHQVSTSMADKPENTSAILYPTTYTSDGSTVVMVPKLYTYTSNGGIYTSERMVEVTQSSSEGSTKTTDRKNAVVPIVAAVLSVVIIGTIASFLGCCIWRRRRRRRRAEQAISEKDPFAQGAMSEKTGTSRSGSKRSRGTAETINKKGTGTLPRTLSSSATSVNDHVMETMSIAEGTVTPFTLPPPPAARSAQKEVGHGGGGAGRLPSGYRGSGMHLIEPEEMESRRKGGRGDEAETDTLMAPGHLRRPSDLTTINTSMSDDDVYAEDGSSLARTLTSESQFSGNVESIFDSPAAVGRRDPIDTLSAQSTVRSQGRWLTFGEGTASTGSPFGTHLTIPSSASPFRPVEVEYYDETPTTDRDSENPFADPEPSKKARSDRRSILSVSDGGQSEGSNPQTEASYKTGDDASARALPLGAKWKVYPGEKVAVSRRMSTGASSLSQQSFGGWSDSIDENSDSDNETIQGDERILGDDESWVNGSEFSRRRNAAERFT